MAPSLHVPGAGGNDMKLLAGLLVAASMYAAADKDMQRAIAWERHKDQVAARQARLEKKHPSVQYNDNNSANRSAEDDQQSTVKDPGPDGKWSGSSKVKK
jgi:hypothetical protein